MRATSKVGDSDYYITAIFGSLSSEGESPS